MEPTPHRTALRFYELDLLRFLAAISVVLYHYTYRAHAQGNYSPVAFLGLDSITRYGWLGVELFFIISGYVVLLSAYNKTAKQFLISRIIRLYPAYWVACTVTFLVVSYFGPNWPEIGWDNFNLSMPQYLWNMTMLNSFFHVDTIDTSYWSLKYEIIFYAFTILIIILRIFKYLIVLLLLWMLYTSAASLGYGASMVGMTKYSSYFISGVLFFMIQHKLARMSLLYLMLFWSLILSVVSVVLEIRDMRITFSDQFSIYVGIFAVIAFHIVFLLVITRQVNLQRYSWLTRLGALTYPLYLLHGTIGFLVLKYTAQINKYVVLAGLLIVMLAAAQLLHKQIEMRFSKPLGNLLDKLFSWAKPMLLSYKS